MNPEPVIDGVLHYAGKRYVVTFEGHYKVRYSPDKSVPPLMSSDWKDIALDFAGALQ